MKFRIVATIVVFLSLVVAYAIFSSDSSSPTDTESSEFSP